MEGTVEKLSSQESDTYFNSRPKASQISAHISTYQSSVVSGRKEMMNVKDNLDRKYEKQPVPRPDYW